MQSWTYIERRNSNPLPYHGVERRSQRTNSGPRTEEPVLIQRTIARDREAFARLYDRHVDRIFRYINLLVGDQRVAEDLTAQVFRRAWQTITAYPRSQHPFAAWLYRLASDAVSAFARSHRPAEQAARTTDPGQVDQGLSQGLSTLDEPQRQVLLLRFLEGYNVEQIAQITGQSSETVRVLQYRALVQLSGKSRTR